MSEEPKQLVLHDLHVAAGATMVERNGWLLPAHYGDPEAEAAAVRNKAGVFDTSNLGRIRVRGDGAVDLLEQVCSADAVHQEDDTALLTDILGSDGRPLDKVFLLRLEDFWVVTTSAIGRGPVLARLKDLGETLGAKADDQTFKTSQLTAAGPAAATVLDGLLPEPVSGTPRGSAKTGTVGIARYIAMRTGRTKQWSVEAILPNILIEQAWRHITEKSGDKAFPPVGVTAQEALAKEAGLG